MIWPLGQSGPGALGSGEDSPTSSTPGWAQGARKFDLMPGYIMCAERAAGVGRAGRWEPFVHGLAVCSRRSKRGYLEPFFAAVPEAHRVRQRLEVGARGCPSAAAGRWPPADIPCSRTLNVELGWVLPDGPPPNPEQLRSEPHFLPGLWAAVCPTGSKLLCLPGTEASFQLRLASVPAQEGHSVIPQISAFPPGLEWKLGGQWRDSEESLWLLCAQLAWGEEYGDSRFQCLLPPSGPLRGPPRLPSSAGTGGIPHLK